MKSTLIIITALVLSLNSVLVAEDTPALGLAERRALSEYQRKVYPAQLEAIQAAAGFEVPLDVKWELIAKSGEAGNYMSDDYWTNIFFKPLAMALADITKDDMGKQALKARLRQIVIVYMPDTAPASNYANGVKFEEGVLTINFTPYSNVHDIKPRADAVRSVLEPAL